MEKECLKEFWYFLFKRPVVKKKEKLILDDIDRIVSLEKTRRYVPMNKGGGIESRYILKFGRYVRMSNKKTKVLFQGNRTRQLVR